MIISDLSQIAGRRYPARRRTQNLAGGVAPMLFARVYDVTASYDNSFLVATGQFVFGALIVLSMNLRPHGLLDAQALARLKRLLTR